MDYKAGKRRHRPTVEELARTLALAERHRTLGQTEHATAPGTMAMLWFLVLTGQRTGQIAETRRLSVESIEPEAGVPGPGLRAVDEALAQRAHGSGGNGKDGHGMAPLG